MLQKCCNVVNNIANVVRNVDDVVNNVVNVANDVVNIDCELLCAFLLPKHSLCNVLHKNHCQMLQMLQKCCENVVNVAML